MKLSKKLISTITILLLTTSMITTSVAAMPEYGKEYENQPTTKYSKVFNDVPKSYWAFEYIMEMVDRGIISGYPNGYFYPDNTITRAEFAKIMCLAAGMEISAVDSTSYKDVSPTDWYAPYVEAGKYYLSGYISNDEKYYLPDSNALREDIAVALVKLKGYDTSIYDESILKAMFTDYQSISHGARKYISVAVENGLISGYGDNTFRGQNTVTRAEAATLLWRAYQYGNSNKVFDKEELEVPAQTTPEMYPTPNNPSIDITTESENEEKLKLTLSVDNTNINVKSGETAEFTVTIGFNYLADLNNNQPRTGYIGDIDGDADILENIFGSERKTQNNETVTLYRTKELEAGKYVLTVTVEDDYSILSEKVTINVTEPEPEYTFELKTITTGVKSVDAIIATNDGAFFLQDRSVYEVLKDGNSVKNLIEKNNVEYLGDLSLSKAELDSLESWVVKIGYDSYSDKRYCILAQRTLGHTLYLLYDLDSKEYIDITEIWRSDEVRSSDSPAYYSMSTFNIDQFGNIICGRAIIDYHNNIVTGIPTNRKQWSNYSQTIIDNNLYITSMGNSDDILYSYNNRTGNGDIIDYHIKENSRLICAGGEGFYFRGRSNIIYLVNTSGDSEILLCVDDIDNIDGRTINMDAMQFQTMAVSPDGVFYYWDVNYNSIRQLSRK